MPNTFVRMQTVNLGTGPAGALLHHDDAAVATTELGAIRRWAVPEKAKTRFDKSFMGGALSHFDWKETCNLPWPGMASKAYPSRCYCLLTRGRLKRLRGQLATRIESVMRPLQAPRTLIDTACNTPLSKRCQASDSIARVRLLLFSFT